MWGSMQLSKPKGVNAHKTHNPCSLSVFTPWEQEAQQTLAIADTSRPDSVFSILAWQHKNNMGTTTVLLKFCGLQWHFSPVEALGAVKLISALGKFRGIKLGVWDFCVQSTELVSKSAFGELNFVGILLLKLVTSMKGTPPVSIRAWNNPSTVLNSTGTLCVYFCH